MLFPLASLCHKKKATTAEQPEWHSHLPGCLWLRLVHGMLCACSVSQTPPPLPPNQGNDALCRAHNTGKVSHGRHNSRRKHLLVNFCCHLFRHSMLNWLTDWLRVVNVVAAVAIRAVIVARFRLVELENWILWLTFARWFRSQFTLGCPASNHIQTRSFSHFFLSRFDLIISMLSDAKIFHLKIVNLFGSVGLGLMMMMMTRISERGSPSSTPFARSCITALSTRRLSKRVCREFKLMPWMPWLNL